MNFKEIEMFISQVKSVISCKIVANNDIIEEIHILSNTERNPKQISRDIQTVLMSKFGLDIDYKKISIAQIYEKPTINKDFRLKLKSINFTTLETMAEVKVVLESDDGEYEGKDCGINTIMNSQRLLSSATLKAVENFLGTKGHFALEDVGVMNIAHREIVVTAINFIANSNEQLLSGCAFINKDIREAVVKSTLDAINRRIVKYYYES